MPRGPRRNFRPVADSMSQPIALDIERHLPGRLAGVEQVRDAGRARHAPDLGGGIDQAAVGRHVRDRDQLDLAVDRALQRLDRDLPVLVVGDRLDHGAGAPRHLQIGDVVAGILRHAGEDAVAGAKRKP